MLKIGAATREYMEKREIRRLFKKNSPSFLQSLTDKALLMRSKVLNDLLLRATSNIQFANETAAVSCIPGDDFLSIEWIFGSRSSKEKK